MLRRAFVLSSAGTAALVAGCLGDDGDDDGETYGDLPGEVTVEVSDGAFDPLVSHVETGGTVTWENTGEESYRVDAYQFHGDSTAWTFREVLEPGETASHTFEEAGRYDFYDAAAENQQFTTCGRIRVGPVDEGQSLPCR